MTDEEGYLTLNTLHNDINITVQTHFVEDFNRSAKSYMTDAEGTYIYDLVAIGGFANTGADLSLYATEILKDYIGQGYGFLIGHDTLYGYMGNVKGYDFNQKLAQVKDKMTNGTDEEKAAAKAEYTRTSYSNTSNLYMPNFNRLMGSNKTLYETEPDNTISRILTTGDIYTTTNTTFGNIHDDTLSNVIIRSTVYGDPETDVQARVPTRYPYDYKNGMNSVYQVNGTHTNQQVAYGKIWIDFETNTKGRDPAINCIDPFLDNSRGGTSNFYLTTYGNVGLNQIGHEKFELKRIGFIEASFLANTIMYLAQRFPCYICRSEQGGNTKTHAAVRISSEAELQNIGTSNSFIENINGCYILTEDLELSANWKPIKNFTGHFNANGHKITFSEDTPEGNRKVFEQTEKNPAAWNLGIDRNVGEPTISQTVNKVYKKTTGVARVAGYLKDLFGNRFLDYSDYYIEIEGSDGKIYNCEVNNESYYVISNLPVKLDENTESGTVKLKAHVYTKLNKVNCNHLAYISLNFNLAKYIHKI